jgi:pimeloyl-ACP methyl ester carboxylesterase
VPPLPELAGVRHHEIPLPTGVRLHVAEAGPADAPALMLVHGWPQHWWMWRDVLPALSERRRVLCPDLRGLGWSGAAPDGNYTKGRLADDLAALLDVLGIERAGYLGHDWGGWVGWLLALRRPERIERLMAVSILHPWVPYGEMLRNLWRLAYMLPLGTPVLGPALVRDGRAVRAALGPRMPDDDAAVYVDALREPARAEASSAYYRQFQLREAPRLHTFARARLAVPVRVLFGRHDPVLRPSQLAGLDRHVDDLEVEVVDGGHFLVDERPELVADRAAAWFG